MSEQENRWIGDENVLRGQCLLRLVVPMAIFLLGCGYKTPTDSAQLHQPDDPVVQMRAAMRAGDWQLASQYSQRALIVLPDDPDLLTDAAKVAAFSDRKRDAAHLLVDAAVKAGFQPVSRVDYAVQALIEVGELYRAIEVLEEFLTAHPKQNTHRRTLVGFLGECSEWIGSRRTCSS